MSSEKYHYESGAIHNDHHKEINIGSVPERALNEIIKNFFKDDAEEAEYKEVNDNLDKIEEAHAEVPKNDADLIERLKPIFYNNEEDVKLFLKEISGMKPGDITDLVNRWTKDKRISDYGYSRKGVLWEILNEAGLYTKSRQNWNRRVD